MQHAVRCKVQRLTGPMVLTVGSSVCENEARHFKPSPLWKVSIPSGAEYPPSFWKLCVILETGTLGSTQCVRSISLQRLMSSATLLQRLASIISISLISWETQRIILSLSVLLSAGLNDRKNNSNRMKEHGTLKSQGMKPLNENKTKSRVFYFLWCSKCVIIGGYYYCYYYFHDS